jgi:hypothetical protein
MTVFAYDATYDPAMPTCDVVLTAASSGERMALTAIIDTGADATLVPLRYLQAIGARRVFEAGLHSQWGERRTVFFYGGRAGRVADVAWRLCSWRRPGQRGDLGT